VDPADVVRHEHSVAGIVVRGSGLASGRRHHQVIDPDQRRLVDGRRHRSIEADGVRHVMIAGCKTKGCLPMIIPLCTKISDIILFELHPGGGGTLHAFLFAVGDVTGQHQGIEVPYPAACRQSAVRG